VSAGARVVKINRASAVYLIMATIFVAGLWIILTAGATLRPPEDFAGDWKLISLDGQEKEGVVSINQSGRHLRISGFDDRDLSMKIVHSDDEAGKHRVQMRDERADVEITFVGPEHADGYETFVRRGESNDHWIMKSVARTYPTAHRPTTQHAQ
jgi:hypothetical protein